MCNLCRYTKFLQAQSHTHTCTHTRTRTHTHTHTQTHAYTYPYTHVHTHACMCVSLHLYAACTHTYAHTHMNTYALTHAHTHICINIHIYTINDKSFKREKLLFHWVYSWSQLNYLIKTDLDSSIYLCKNTVFMCIWVVVILNHLGPKRHKDGVLMEKYRAAQVVSLWPKWT